MFDDSQFFDKGYNNKEALDKGTFCSKMDQVIDKLDKIISLLGGSKSHRYDIPRPVDLHSCEEMKEFFEIAQKYFEG